MTTAPLATRRLQVVRTAAGLRAGVVAALAASIIGVAGDGAVSRVPLQTQLIGSFPITPPPSPKLIPHLSQFWLLLGEYQAAAFDSRVPFGVWLVARGVVDPETHGAMMELYVWYLSVTQRAVHSAG